MSLIQRALKAVLPASTIARMEAESRSWKLSCPEGHVTDVWTMGGVRFGAASSGKRVSARCPGCGRVRSMRMHREA